MVSITNPQGEKPSNGETFEKHCLEALIERVERLQKIIKLNTASGGKVSTVIIADIVFGVFLAASGYCGKYLGELMFNYMLGGIRQSSGFCQSCNNHIHPSLSFQPICHDCEEKNRKEAEDSGDDHPKNE